MVVSQAEFFYSLHLRRNVGFGVKELLSGGSDGVLANKRNPNPDDAGEMLKIQHVYCMGAILFC